MYAQILSTYPGMMAQGRDHLPPIIHPLQLAGGVDLRPVQNCLSLTRMWEDQIPGPETLARESVRRKMTQLLDEYQT